MPSQSSHHKGFEVSNLAVHTASQHSQENGTILSTIHASDTSHRSRNFLKRTRTRTRAEKSTRTRNPVDSTLSALKGSVMLCMCCHPLSTLYWFLRLSLAH